MKQRLLHVCGIKGVDIRWLSVSYCMFHDYCMIHGMHNSLTPMLLFPPATNGGKMGTNATGDHALVESSFGMFFLQKKSRGDEMNGALGTTYDGIKDCFR